MAKRGPKLTYDPATHIPMCEQLFSEGKTYAEVAKQVGVGIPTLYEWQQRDPELANAIKRARDAVDVKVEASLFKRAMGYSHPDVHITAWQGSVIVTPITKHYPPDATSMIFWLKNRRPAEWRDRVEQTGADGGPIVIKWQQ